MTAPEARRLGRGNAGLLAVLAALVSIGLTGMLLFFVFAIGTMNCGVPRTSQVWLASSTLLAGVAAATALTWTLVASLVRVAIGRSWLRRRTWIIGAALAIALSGAHARASVSAVPTTEQCNQLDLG